MPEAGKLNAQHTLGDILTGGHHIRFANAPDKTDVMIKGKAFTNELF